MRVTTTPEAAAFVHARGGSLFVWGTDHRCCGGRLTLLDTSTQLPSAPRPFERFEVEGFELYLSAGAYRLPEGLTLELKGRRHPRVAAFWNGCAYVG